MINGKLVYGLIPARGGSKGVPKKNIKKLGGKPLIAYSIEDAKGSNYVDKVIVSTDSEEIADVSREHDAEIPFFRSKEAATDTATDMDVLHDFLDQLKEHGIDEPAFIVFLRPTSPFRVKGDVDRAVEALDADEKGTGARLIGDVPYPPFWMKVVKDNRLVSFMKSEYEYARRQDLPEVFRGTGEVEVLKPATIREGSMYGEEIVPVKSRNKVIMDIDTIEDFERAEYEFGKLKGERDE